jgi:hypothetical protein
MKRTVFIFFCLTHFLLKSQVALQEDFTAPFNPTVTGWSVQNLSASPNPTNSWFQGISPTNFPAYNGAANDYFATNFLVTTSGSPVTLSCWLLTPTLTIVNGAVIEFATRTRVNPATFPDRLEVYLSTAGSGTNVGTTPTSVGTFSTLLVSINPSLTVTGYPSTWTIYSATISGVPTPTVGRIGFRYHVTNGGPSWQAPNSDYIGLDAVKYTMPCLLTANNYTTCAGQTLTLTTSGGGAGTSYSWSPVTGSSSSIVITPTTSTTYTISYSESGFPCTSITSSVTISSQLNVNIATSASTLCAGKTATLTASGAASSYTWINNGSNSSVITVTPAATTIYSVAGSSGIFPSNFCAGANTIQVTVLPLPNLSSTVNPVPKCTGIPFTMSASGAASYSWMVTSTSGYTSNPIVLNHISPGLRSYTLVGYHLNGCKVEQPFNFTIHPTPAITAASSQTLTCVNEHATISASGAATYTWSGASTSSASSFQFVAGSIPGTVVFSVSGTSPEGCVSETASVSIIVDLCTKIPGEENFYGTSVYPNPFTNEIMVNNFSGMLTIFNSLGTIIFSENLEGNSIIYTGSLPSGVYILELRAKDCSSILSRKLIKE